MNPGNAGLRNRLSKTAKTAADDSALILDAAAQNYLGELVSQATEALGDDPPPEDIVRTEDSLQRLASQVALLHASDQAEPGEQALAMRPVRVTGRQIEAALMGLCPGFFPFC